MKIEAIVLAAGKGTRMKSNLPKVMCDIAGKPMISWVVEALKPACDAVNIVTGHGGNLVEKYLMENFKDLKFSFQAVQDGTGGAVRSALPNIAADADLVFICAGDAPLVKTEIFERAKERFLAVKPDVLIVSALLNDGENYGRVVRNEKGEVVGIVEYLDADPQELKIKEINSGIYLVKRKFLSEAIHKIKNDNAKKEYYLTDVVKIAVLMRRRVETYIEEDAASLSGVNTQEELKEAEKILLARRQ